MRNKTKKESIMKSFFVLTLCVCFFTMIFIPGVCYPQSKEPVDTLLNPSEKRGEYILFDLIVLRPLGVAACAIGAAGVVVSVPFVAFSGGFENVVDELLAKPAKFTFGRQLGDMDFTH